MTRNHFSISRDEIDLTIVHPCIVSWLINRTLRICKYSGNCIISKITPVAGIPTLKALILPVLVVMPRIEVVQAIA
ncbi:Uncharacterised protein [Mycobacteroides abscessus subsp. abscessus]|nr:Uncharacterised protein [Mycobacteroides abscessus subsp. abscessus]